MNNGINFLFGAMTAFALNAIWVGILGLGEPIYTGLFVAGLTWFGLLGIARGLVRKDRKNAR